MPPQRRRWPRPPVIHLTSSPGLERANQPDALLPWHSWQQPDIRRTERIGRALSPPAAPGLPNRSDRQQTFAIIRRADSRVGMLASKETAFRAEPTRARQT